MTIATVGRVVAGGALLLVIGGGPILSQSRARLSGHFKPGEPSWTGDISSLPQNITNLPLSTVAAREDSIWFSSSDGRTFAGTMSQRGQVFPFALRRSATVSPAEGAPPPPPPAWRGLIGEYGSDTLTRVMILERDGHLVAWFDSAHSRLLEPTKGGGFRLDRGPTAETVHFRVSAQGRARAILLGDTVVRRRAIGPEEGSVFRVTPLRPVAELRHVALAASPPEERGTFLPTDLVELVRLDSTIRLDIRYASSRNFLGQALYTQARAFLQRPAAEALVRAGKALRAQGYGLLIHDGYRPWYVTKMFWDATPPAQHEFVANPATGSRHNRGEAVDLSLYELKTGRPVEMPGTYDEFSHRSYPTYEGGTSRQRWHRELLRSAMEAEGFTVFTSEWWHFDYKDWKQYHIGNVTFEKLR